MTRKPACTKKPYGKAGAARHAMREAQDAGIAAADAKVYPCPNCGRWHWGHPGGGRRALRTITSIDRAIAADKLKRERAGKA